MTAENPAVVRGSYRSLENSVDVNGLKSQPVKLTAILR